MIKTYLYGTPHGFDFYEKESAFSDFFQGFYISSRKGKRLMVNRREDETTVYSFLHYGLMEVGGRPNSFFGMSLVMDEGRYTPDFQQMFKWFEYIFEKLLERGGIFKKNEAGIIQYRIDKFEDASEDVEWVKINLPKIFSKEAATRILNYDNSFKQGQAGKVACFNDEESEKNLLAAFREFRWITLSPGFEKSIELDAGELKERLGELNGELAPLATQVAIGKLVSLENDLEQMHQEAESTCVDINKYLSSIRDEEEQKTFGELLNRYKELSDNICQLQQTLLEKQNHSTSEITPEEKVPAENQIEEEGGEDVITKKEENKEEAIHKNKKRYNLFLPISNASCEQISKLKRYGLLVGSVLLLYIIWVFAFKDRKEGTTVSNNPKTEILDTAKRNLPKEKNKVDPVVFNKYISSNAIKEAYDYLKNKEDQSDYKYQLMVCIENCLWNLIDTQGSNDKTTVSDNMMEFYIANKEILDFVGFKEEDEEKWNKLNEDYWKLWSVLQKEAITQKEKEEAKAIAQQYSDKFSEWITLLDKKEIIRSTPSSSSNNEITIPKIKLICIRKDGSTIISTIEVTKNIGKELFVGQYVEIHSKGIRGSNYPGSPFEHNSKLNCLRIKLIKEGEYTYNIGAVGITITAKPKYKAR